MYFCVGFLRSDGFMVPSLRREQRATPGGVGTGMTLEPCSGEGNGGGSVPSRVGDAAPATLVQKFQRVTPPQPNQGDDVQGVGVPNGCPCWNVRDNNAHTGASNHGVNGMVVQVSRSTQQALSVLYAQPPPPPSSLCALYSSKRAVYAI